MGKNIANALGKKYHRISLGGIRDVAEIKGHRRTYIGSLPGLIIQALKIVGVKDPVILLDEIDKVGRDSFHGDPMGALLEVLDPEQNQNFLDHYLNIPFDLSNVFFICTANDISALSHPLHDRMEIIQMRGYTFDEKLEISKTFLLPKQIKCNGLDKYDIKISDEALNFIILNYTREAGVRQLERNISSVLRVLAVDICNDVEHLDEVNVSFITKHLGPPPLSLTGFHDKNTDPGIVSGLSYTGSGNGSVLPIEAVFYPGKGKLILTGSLGDVIKESANIAYAWVKSHINHYGNLDYSKIDLHIHMPSGSVPKDGPSGCDNSNNSGFGYLYGHYFSFYKQDC